MLLLCLTLTATNPAEAAQPDAQAVEQLLRRGVLDGPPVPKGCEWLPDIVRHEVERSLNRTVEPLKRAVEGIRDVVHSAVEAVRFVVRVIFWTAVALVVLLLIAVIVGLLIAWRIFLITWNISPVLSAAAKALELVAKR